MQGTVLQYERETNTGFISGFDGNRYSFARINWTTGNVEPRVGLTVDFEIVDKTATQIIVVKSANANGRTRLAAILFALLLGGIGIHKFYLGRTVWGIVYLLFCWTFIPAIIALIEGILYAAMSEEDFNKKYNS
ncbi:TM2 domain-containing protein [Asticcacaulis biprosthecium]|nr:TM2 domain-containing protein [Asticcacaulis biprosthecium]